MHRRLLTALILGCGLLPLALLSRSAASTPAQSLSEIALQAHDLPSRFFEASGAYESNSNIAHANGVTVASLRRRGRIMGYLATYLRDSGRGAVLVSNDLVEYKTERDALAEYRLGVAGDAQFRGNAHYRKLANPSNGTALVTFRCSCDNYGETRDVLDSYQGKYYFWIELHFITGTASPKAMARRLLHYASVIKSRVPLRALPAPSSVPSPSTPPPAPTPTPISQSPPVTAITCTYADSSASGVGVYDSVRGNRVCIETRDKDGSSNFSGYLGTKGQKPPVGDIFLYPWVTERKAGGSGTFASSISDFEAQGNDGRLFPATANTPYKLGDQLLRPETLDVGAANDGYVSFVVPEHDGPYTMLWNEGGVLQFTPAAVLRVFPSH